MKVGLLKKFFLIGLLLSIIVMVCVTDACSQDNPAEPDPIEEPEIKEEGAIK